jgi:DNA-directed RNA polymerase specialized sigma24 family protein
MSQPEVFLSDSGDRSGHFKTTHWSVVIAAVAGDPESEDALERLCGNYWYPVYAYLRRRGHSPPDAQDLTQGFFAGLLERNGLRTVDPGKGRFRTFLLVSLKNFLANEWDRSKAWKRGGRLRFVSLEAAEGEDRFQLESVQQLTPDRLFEQSWAITLLDTVMRRLKAEFESQGKGAQFQALQVHLSGDRDAPAYAASAAGLGLGSSAMKMAVLRMRRRFGELLREEIASTVASPRDIDEEIRSLFAAVAVG